MKYVIAGKSDSYLLFLKTTNAKQSDVKNCRKESDLSEVKDDDTIILLHGWWGKKWAVEKIKFLQREVPTIQFIYRDGPFGEEFRKKGLKSETIHSRFELLDFGK